MKTGLTKNDSLSIKGIAIIMLVFHHLFCEVKRFDGYTIDFSPFSQSSIVSISFMFKICVSIFAFITGYGLLKSIKKQTLNAKSCFKWNVNRLIKTMSGFWLIYVLAFIVTMIINRLPVKTYFDDGIFDGLVYIAVDFLGLANFFSTPTLCSTWWYMSAAIMFILSVPMIYAASKKFGYLPVIAVVFALPRLLNIGYLSGVNLYTFLTPVVFGMMFADYDLFERISDKSPENKVGAYALHFLVFGILTAVGAVVAIKIDRILFWEVSYGIVPIAFICFFRYCIVRIPVINQVLTFLGKHQ